MHKLLFGLRETYHRDRDIWGIRKDESYFFEFPTAPEVLSHWEPGLILQHSELVEDNMLCSHHP